jgi:hypothetical protein
VSAVEIRLEDVRFYMRNVHTRMPFKYGAAVLTAVPILHVVAHGALKNGTPVQGVAADILPPKWFDKDPAKSYEDNVADLLWAARAARSAYLDAARSPEPFFAIWQAGYEQTVSAGDAHGLNRLTAVHGSTLMERALIDAVGCGVGASYFELLKANLLGLDLGAIHPELRGVEPGQVIGTAPLEQLHVRHTVGLADPIVPSDIAPEERLDDGLPQSLADCVERQGLTYFKVKVNGDLEADLARLAAIAELLDGRNIEYKVTLDGNEQYQEMDALMGLIEALAAAQPRLYERIIYVEQPLERSVALDAALEPGIRAAAARRPLLIDESDDALDTFRQALALGYEGVSSKACKGLVKALANSALAWQRTAAGYPCFVSAEDLTVVPVVSLHQDLAHVAALGIDHVERNGHHYVRGLDHLSAAERAWCFERHGDLYRAAGQSGLLDIRDGQIAVSSLQRPGLGVDGAVDIQAMQSLAEAQLS